MRWCNTAPSGHLPNSLFVCPYGDDRSQLMASAALLGTTTTPSAKAARQMVEQVSHEFNSNTKTGLSQRDVPDLRAIYGWNELDKAEDESMFSKFIKSFTENPLILLLLGSAAVSLLMGQLDDALSITMVTYTKNKVYATLYVSPP